MCVVIKQKLVEVAIKVEQRVIFFISKNYEWSLKYQQFYTSLILQLKQEP
jgi:hypothetical protein